MASLLPVGQSMVAYTAAHAALARQINDEVDVAEERIQAAITEGRFGDAMKFASDMQAKGRKLEAQADALAAATGTEHLLAAAKGSAKLAVGGAVMTAKATPAGRVASFALKHPTLARAAVAAAATR